MTSFHSSTPIFSCFYIDQKLVVVIVTLSKVALAKQKKNVKMWDKPLIIFIPAKINQNLSINSLVMKILSTRKNKKLFVINFFRNNNTIVFANHHRPSLAKLFSSLNWQFWSHSIKTMCYSPLSNSWSLKFENIRFDFMTLHQKLKQIQQG